MSENPNHPIRPQAWKIADLTLRELLKLEKDIKQEDCSQALRLAVLGDCATQHYTRCLAGALKVRDFWPEIFEAEFDSIQQEMLNPTSEFHQHRPDYVVFFNCLQFLEGRFSLAVAESFVADVVADITGQWQQVRDRHRATILQHNFCLPLDFTFGNHTSSSRASLRRAVEEINTQLRDRAETMEGIRIIDTEFQAAYHGKKKWLDEGLWCDAKQALSPHFLPPLVKVVSDVILQTRGVVTKALILDLDNTLWGGILGDVGISGLELGEVNSMGIAFSRFQRAIKQLKDRGILLAVASKNSQEEVEKVFNEHPDMELSLDDIVCVIANYEDKANNILKIRERLDIGLDSLVFLDDSPFERDFVRNSLPVIQVPELSEDPTQYMNAIARWNLFESGGYSSEDSRRTDMYKAEEKRDALKQKSPDLHSYLESLQMTAEVEPFNEFTLPRASQLINRSNQFNLTTIRHHESELKEFSRAEEKYVTFTVRLRDKLGDNGIVSLIIGKKEKDELLIDSWIMSCRVLGRKLENATLKLVMEKAKRMKCSSVVGQYIPSQKNAMVADHYPRLGFKKIDAEREVQRFIYRVSDYENPQDIPIEIVEKQNNLN
jgi:FkbH-like protein